MDQNAVEPTRGLRGSQSREGSKQVGAPEQGDPLCPHCGYLVGFNRLAQSGDARPSGPVAVLWVSMTVAFEFGFGHFVAGRPWAVLLADYNILQGRIWVLVPVTVASAPYLTARLRGLF